MSILSFERLKIVSLQRALRWHRGGLAEWSVNDWLCAMGGEAGEALNAGKKHRRIQPRSKARPAKGTIWPQADKARRFCHCLRVPS